MTPLSTAIVWLVATASALVLAAGGYLLALARLRARLARSRDLGAALQERLSRAAEDPFGELRVLDDQLLRIRQRLERVGSATGQPADLDLAASKTIPPPGPAWMPTPDKPGATAELEADLELVRREVYTKSRRIDELEAEKRRLGEKIVGLEETLRQQAAAPAPRRPSFVPATTVEGPAAGAELAGLIDTLQQEADALRAELAERDARIRTLERSDATGLVHELERIRRELQTRTEELATLQERFGLAEKGNAQARAKATAAEQEKEAMASRALEAAAELRRAQEKIRELERQIASHMPGPFPGVSQPAMPTAPWPAAAPTTAPGRPLPPPAPASATAPPPEDRHTRPTTATPALPPRPGPSTAPPTPPAMPPPRRTGEQPAVARPRPTGSSPILPPPRRTGEHPLLTPPPERTPDEHPPGLPPPRRTGEHAVLPPPRRTGEHAVLPPPRRTGEHAAAPSARRTDRARRPSGSIFPLPPSRGGDDT